MNKTIFYCLIFIFMGTGITLKFSQSHESMPIGCDEFGYLNLSRTFAEGVSNEGPYFDELLDTLRGKGITEPELAWMITPHAYHIIPGTKLVINQYPPGTSWLLSFIPIEFRKILFPTVALFLLMLLPLWLSGTLQKPGWTLFDLLFPVYIFLLSVSAPFTTELARVNSLAVTFGLLLSAGMTIRTRPLVACFLIALSTNFRVVNVLMILPVLLFLPFQSLKNSTSFRFNLLLLIKFAGLVIVALLPLLIYNFQLLGNPFASTYSSIDTAVTSGRGVFANFAYYFSLDNHWLRVHLFTIIILLTACISNRCSMLDFLKYLTFPFINYLFFGWHKVTMDYYPYASAMILTGIAFYFLNNVKFPENKLRHIVSFTGIGIAVLVLLSGYNRYRKKEHITFEEAKRVYAPLCEYDIVWSDLLSGTTEYVCANNGFRFATSTPRARNAALVFLHQKKMKQVILLNDVPVDPKQIENEINDAGLPYTLINHKVLGPMVVINSEPTGINVKR